jgi:hypothetical protein
VPQEKQLGSPRLIDEVREVGRELGSTHLSLAPFVFLPIFVVILLETDYSLRQLVEAGETPVLQNITLELAEVYLGQVVPACAGRDEVERDVRVGCEPFFASLMF